MRDQTGLLAVVGAITGPLGFVLSLLLFFRDRSRVQVGVSWNMITIPRDPTYPETFVSVQVVNVGRRPIFVSHIHSVIEGEKTHGLLARSASGVTLTEGSPAFSAIADEVHFHGKPWWKIRFAAQDAAGRSYFSHWPVYPPDWAKDQAVPRFAIARNRLRNRFKRWFALLF
jgi:hypothetical protein